MLVREAFPFAPPPEHLLRDRDSISGLEFQRRDAGAVEGHESTSGHCASSARAANTPPAKQRAEREESPGLERSLRRWTRRRFSLRANRHHTGLGIGSCLVGSEPRQFRLEARALQDFWIHHVLRRFTLRGADNSARHRFADQPHGVMRRGQPARREGRGPEGVL